MFTFQFFLSQPQNAAATLFGSKERESGGSNPGRRNLCPDGQDGRTSWPNKQTIQPGSTPFLWLQVEVAPGPAPAPVSAFAPVSVSVSVVGVVSWQADVHMQRIY